MDLYNNGNFIFRIYTKEDNKMFLVHLSILKMIKVLNMILIYLIIMIKYYYKRKEEVNNVNYMLGIIFIILLVLKL